MPTVAVMSEASGPPRYPPVRFRSSVHPAPSLPPIDTKQRSLVGVNVEVKEYFICTPSQIRIQRYLLIVSRSNSWQRSKVDGLRYSPG